MAMQQVAMAVMALGRLRSSQYIEHEDWASDISCI